ncbi:universal stress protein [Natronobiforma cellulositropha]|uniref:universal stress protein n=1 Tax=Natronobiforma cellulositropha TaxID=1679076 RepID=UPI0021D612DE|nr:universal stress protein [Natronobiforma cellulositropha]
MTRHVLVAMDDSAPARAALEYALETVPDARFTVLHVVDELESHYGGQADVSDGSPTETTPSCFETAEELAAAHGIGVETALTSGPQPAAAILEYANGRAVDELVVGSAGRGGVSRVLLGSVAEALARRASCPVTIVS